MTVFRSSDKDQGTGEHGRQTEEDVSGLYPGRFGDEVIGNGIGDEFRKAENDLAEEGIES